MRAVRQHAYGEPLVVEDVEAPVAADGESLVAVAFGAVVVVLVDPPDGLVLCPQGGDVWGVEFGEEGVEARRGGEVAGLGGGAIEEGGEVDREFVEVGLQARLVGGVAITQGRLVLALPRRAA